MGDEKMTVHELNIDSCYWKSIIDGWKTFEVRNNDRNFSLGDQIRFKCSIFFKPTSGTESLYEIIYILNDNEFPEALKEGYCILGIKKVEQVVTFHSATNFTITLGTQPETEKQDDRLKSLLEIIDDLRQLLALRALDLFVVYRAHLDDRQDFADIIQSAVDRIASAGNEGIKEDYEIDLQELAKL